MVDLNFNTSVILLYVSEIDFQVVKKSKKSTLNIKREDGVKSRRMAKHVPGFARERDI